MENWTQYLRVALLIMIRISGAMVFIPVLSSAAISPRIKAGFVVAVTFLLAPAIARLPNTAVHLGYKAILGELGVGLLFGISLAMINEALLFAGAILGMQFSFSLVNLMDPNSMIETPVLGELLGWLSILVLIGAGLDRAVLAAFIRSFQTVPAGQAIVQAATGAAIARMAGGIFLAGMQLAGLVIAVAFVVEVTVAMVGRMSPQLPAMIVGIPLKTLASYLALIASLGLWPVWIEGHFTALLDKAVQLLTTR